MTSCCYTLLLRQRLFFLATVYHYLHCFCINQATSLRILPAEVQDTPNKLWMIIITHTGNGGSSGGSSRGGRALLLLARRWAHWTPSCCSVNELLSDVFIKWCVSGMSSLEETPGHAGEITAEVLEGWMVYNSALISRRLWLAHIQFMNTAC